MLCIRHRWCGAQGVVGSPEEPQEGPPCMGAPCTFVETVREAAAHNSHLLALKRDFGALGEDDAAPPHLGVLHLAQQRHAEEQRKVPPLLPVLHS